MALPATLDKDVPSGSDAPSTLDNVIRDFKLWVLDVFNLADDTAIATALGSITSNGLVYWTFFNTGSDPASAGRLQRNGTDLLFHDGTVAGALITSASTHTLTNKTLTAPIIATIVNGAATLTLPTTTDTLVGRATTDTLTSKTLTAPVIATIVNGAGTLTLPTTTDTLVGRATTDTLTNKTLTTPTIGNFTNAQHDHSSAATGGVVTTVQTGSILMYGAAAAPTGYVLCDGSAISRTTFAALFAVIGTTWGVGDGSTTFNVPDLGGRSPFGKATAGTFATLAATGGAETHTLVTSELPAHTHTYLNYDAAGSVTGGGAISGGIPATQATGSTGSNGAHNNLPPYLTVAFIIKT
jgi:microcystin-dependent protein